jgi:hypothetical protein
MNAGELLRDLRISIVAEKPRLNTSQGAGWMVLYHAGIYLGYESAASLETYRRINGCASMAIQYPNLKTKKIWKQIKVVKEDSNV